MVLDYFGVLKELKYVLDYSRLDNNSDVIYCITLERYNWRIADRYSHFEIWASPRGYLLQLQNLHDMLSKHVKTKSLLDWIEE